MIEINKGHIQMSGTTATITTELGLGVHSLAESNAKDDGINLDDALEALIVDLRKVVELAVKFDKEGN